MTETPPNRHGMADEQEIEVTEWTDDLGLHHEVVEDDPQRRDTLDERLRREAPERLREPRPKHRLTQPDEGLEPDRDDEEIGVDYLDDNDDMSAEERAVRIDPDENLT
ncbi:DUF5709 domain-containing protein [Nonomuraea gerenzanensis]|uniref:DUF5709 domain-containing protein n=1 Tax=Nonomuraea gerenzanensis TaxID=93944 RepID=A0A1M4EKE6_9ACTN|nr:DUF5709 domain-containing protein [Nonomuraea gerenzanensis]UBU10850.1 DUF5709 domain-containing protein [Nonomuraea gerenzanensis]SBO99286.1 hypothetical protein BN4615_P8802 [Nonomuraea gerenzanensis]